MPGEWFQFAVELKETGTLLGDCALKVDEEEQYQAEIGFTLSREHQGKGYASEAVSRLLDSVFGDLGLHRVVAIAFCENERSVALLERLGMRREERFLQSARFEGGWADEYLYAILRDEWYGERRGDDMPEPEITSEPHASEQDAAFVREALALHNVAVTQERLLQSARHLPA
jgi:RimJ/RimL family protein N-acetyltransferase